VLKHGRGVEKPSALALSLITGGNAPGDIMLKLGNLADRETLRSPESVAQEPLLEERPTDNHGTKA
jgi:hypothetical protein